jgi:hypothetical protein
MSDYVRSVRALSAEIQSSLPPDAPLERTPTRGAKPQPIAIVGVHGVSPIQQYAFQDQLATGLLAYLNALDDRRSGVRRAGATDVDPAVEGRSGTERRLANDRRTETQRRSAKLRNVKPERRSGNERRILQWAATPYWPRVSKQTEDPVLKPSALRLHRKSEADPSKPVAQVYDVYEGYWSPFSKGKTNAATLGLWLLRCIFLAISSTARVPASWRKLIWDLAYVFVPLIGALLCFGLAYVGATAALARYLALFRDAAVPSFWSFLKQPFEPLTTLPAQLKTLPWYAAIHLIVSVVLAYLVIQLIALAHIRRTANRRKTELLQDSGDGGYFRSQTIAAQQFHRLATGIFVLAVVSLAIADAALLHAYYLGDWRDVQLDGALLVLTMALVQGGRWLADFVVENILGDVQIYTTHDCNSRFYAIRQQIFSTVTNAVLAPLNAVLVQLGPDGSPLRTLGPDGKPVPDPPLYSRIHVAGHSLGSTIALDVLLRIRQLVYEGALDEDSWGRVRSLTTFGTALEKTRFLLDVRNPSVSAAQQQWQNDAYGRFFTRDEATLGNADNTHGIYWSNHWYWRDVVANQIVSYKSVVKPGTMSFTWKPGVSEHDICCDDLIAHKGRLWAFVHGDYIGDAEFWKSVGPILTRRA